MLTITQRLYIKENKMNKQLQNKKNNNRAFTLVEIMVAIILTTMVLTAAYQIWSRVQARISRSHTKQTLQNELRKVANYMQNDFKSIKFYSEDSDDKNKAVKITGDDKNFTMKFQKFKEVDENEKNKLAQDVVEEVEYKLKSKVLTRTAGGKSKMLSSHCEEIHIQPAVKDGENGEYANALKEVQEAKEAQLDIEITGMMKISGSNEELYHVEQTSVVMRNEYYNKINQTYKSNFELAKLDKKDITGEEASGLLSGDLGENLENLDKDVLERMKESEKEMLKNLEDNLKNLNDSLNGVKPDDCPWYKRWSSNISSFFSGKDNEYTLFTDSKKALINADTSEKAKEAISKLKSNIENQEKKFYQNSYSKKSYESMTDEEKTIFKRAYDMAVQEKTINDAYKELKESDPTAEEPDKNTINIEIQKKIMNDSSASQQEQEEARKIVEVYNSISLEWMDKADKSEMGIYKANKDLMDQANTKLELLYAKEKSDKNIKELDDVIKTK